MFKSLKNVRMITTMAIFIALTIIFSNFLAITFVDRKFSFTFLITALMASLLPLDMSIIAAILADVIGNMIFPTPGGFYPPFILNKIVTVIIYYYFFQKKPINVKNIIIAVVINVIITSILMTSLWVSQLTGNPYFTQIVLRLPTSILNMILNMIVLSLIFKRLHLVLKKKLKNSKVI